MKKVQKILFKISQINLRTIFFNFHYFPFKTAIKLPFFLSPNFKIVRLKGEVRIKGPIKTGMIELGYGNVGIFDRDRSRFLWDVEGIVTFEKNAFIGFGSKIWVKKGGEIFFGENFITTANSSFISNKSIVIGKNSLFSWDILLMDTDFHDIIDHKGGLVNPDKEIFIGENVWIGCRVSVLKGAVIPDNSVIAAGSIITKQYTENNCIYGGNPVKKIKEFKFWKLY